MKPHPKPVTHRDPKYCAFIRKKGCILCGKPAQFHHESGLGDSGGMSKKCSDYFGIPLCDYDHKERGQLGFDSFWAKYWKDPWSIVMNNLMLYLQKKDKSIHVKRAIIDFLIGEITSN
jgi:hypothetical protein